MNSEQIKEETIPVLVPFMTREEFRSSSRIGVISRFFRGDVKEIRSFAKAFYACSIRCETPKRKIIISVFTDALSGATALLPEGAATVRTERCDRRVFGAVFAPKILRNEILNCSKNSIERFFIRKWRELPSIVLEDASECYRVYYLVTYCRSSMVSTHPADSYEYS